jgi:hypothetical protein
MSHRLLLSVSLFITVALPLPASAQEGHFGTPMFMMGQPVWVSPVSRRTLLRNLEEKTTPPLPETVAWQLV